MCSTKLSLALHGYLEENASGHIPHPALSPFTTLIEGTIQLCTSVFIWFLSLVWISNLQGRDVTYSPLNSTPTIKHFSSTWYIWAPWATTEWTMPEHSRHCCLLDKATSILPPVSASLKPLSRWSHSHASGREEAQVGYWMLPGLRSRQLTRPILDITVPPVLTKGNSLQINT